MWPGHHMRGCRRQSAHLHLLREVTNPFLSVCFPNSHVMCVIMLLCWIAPGSGDTRLQWSCGVSLQHMMDNWHLNTNKYSYVACVDKMSWLLTRRHLYVRLLTSISDLFMGPDHIIYLWSIMTTLNKVHHKHDMVRWYFLSLWLDKHKCDAPLNNRPARTGLWDTVKHRGCTSRVLQFEELRPPEMARLYLKEPLKLFRPWQPDFISARNAGIGISELGHGIWCFKKSPPHFWLHSVKQKGNENHPELQ